ncbi:MAG: hypothetical protein U0234_01010 [Sandaracinus sp.]
MRAALLLSIFLGVTTMSAAAQSSRPGMRLTVTRVATDGGFTASGFLVVPTSTIVRTPAPACGDGAVRVEASGRDPHGRIRTAHVATIVGGRTGEIVLGAGACEGILEVTLEDGTPVRGTRGTLHTARVGVDGVDLTMDASEIDAAGVPTTLSGRITLPSR